MDACGEPASRLDRASSPISRNNAAVQAETFDPALN